MDRAAQAENKLRGVELMGSGEGAGCLCVVTSQAVVEIRKTIMTGRHAVIKVTHWSLLTTRAPTGHS